MSAHHLQSGRHDRLRDAGTLNMLPAAIVLLDTQGTIVAANESWERVASASGWPGDRHRVGCNYLQGCDTVGVHPNGTHVAHGIRRILDGTIRDFSCEYMMPGPVPPRWLRVIVAPLRVGECDGCVCAIKTGMSARVCTLVYLRSPTPDTIYVHMIAHKQNTAASR